MEISQWKTALAARDKGTLLAYLETIPRDDWTKVEPWTGFNFLMASCMCVCNMDAFFKLLPLFVVNGTIIDQCSRAGCNVAHYAATKCPKKVEILCLFNVNLQSRTVWNMQTPLDAAIHGENFDCAKVLIANGSRTNFLYYNAKASYQPLLDFEKGVVSCRNVIVTLLGLKKFRNILPKLDRFLVKQVLAVEIWTTRTGVESQEKCQSHQTGALENRN